MPGYHVVFSESEPNNTTKRECEKRFHDLFGNDGPYWVVRNYFGFEVVADEPESPERFRRYEFQCTKRSQW